MTLLLEGTNTLKCYSEEETPHTATTSRRSSGGTDKLTIDNDTGGTGIAHRRRRVLYAGHRGGYRQAPGAVTIKDGTVVAVGGNHGAGIGSAGMGVVSGGSVTVPGGAVNAGRLLGSCIGGGAGNAAVP